MMGALLSDIVIMTVLLLLLSGACAYIYKEKKRGSHCIGCPMAGSCPRKNIGCTQSVSAKGQITRN
ncbi:MAG: FeoB-associated Cys-rich membrane protein [Lachnospiraceae bacterium]|nr:FeoB-associated Cys-rich membrane protein [Lachnospiraceae bacterium]